MAWSRYRKTLAAALLGLVELAGYIVADPRDLPPWVVTAALAVNAAAVYVARNQPPPVAAPTLFARSPEQERRARRGWQPEEPDPRPDPPPRPVE